MCVPRRTAAVWRIFTHTANTRSKMCFSGTLMFSFVVRFCFLVAASSTWQGAHTKDSERVGCGEDVVRARPKGEAARLRNVQPAQGLGSGAATAFSFVVWSAVSCPIHAVTIDLWCDLMVEPIWYPIGCWGGGCTQVLHG